MCASTPIRPAFAAGGVGPRLKGLALGPPSLSLTFAGILIEKCSLEKLLENFSINRFLEKKNASLI